MNIVLIALNVLASGALILFILLHAGRGGGLSDMFGGASMGGAMAGSTVVERNLDRITVVASLIWVLTVVLLGLNLDLGPSTATEVSNGGGTQPAVTVTVPSVEDTTPPAETTPPADEPAPEDTQPEG